ncbi:hypothetical protein GDO86_001390 [Hymenochirus boettgeri]|uniref:Endoplasmic reticulum metallopeptidase 1 n=1 Tax=Hymenochirus boettgeri TaxID=247094 RepID=A0A8T2KGY6_9PIPI|nr:hypothetical protein GDO86_001390 [Hymenochirus boettgeri]
MENKGVDGLTIRRVRYNAPREESSVPQGEGRTLGNTKARTRGVYGSALQILLLLYVLCVRGLVHISLRQLVTPGVPNTDFNATTARQYLQQITTIDSRTVGSPANEIHAVNYLLGRIKEIEEKINLNHRISVDVQRPTGSFSIDFLGGFTSYYDNITNIAVKLEPKNGAEDAVLANCHFDSVANTPGASDDAVSCAVMLEILGKLSLSPNPLKHAIIFLFNGAEENILQGSHGFITQHPWAKMVRAFINLEAAGVGGKELVFQTGPENPWLVQAYAQAAVHPFASVVAQEVFQSGIIPSDTDFRIYRDFGHIPGIDLAFIENGYIYHTKYDTADRIHTDSIQRAGDNILGVLQYLATSSQLADSSKFRHGNMVFFDVCGLFVLSYPARVGTIINYITAVTALFYIGKKTIKYKRGGTNYAQDLMYGLLITLVSWISALVTVLIIAVLVSLAGRALFWYTNFYVSVFLYGSAAVAKLILVHSLAKTFFFASSSSQYLGDLFFDVSLIIWSIPLVFLTHSGLCSAYFFAAWVIFPLLTKLTVQQDIIHQGSPYKFVAVYLLGLFPPYLHTMYHVWAVFEMFTPILGRSGTEIPPDIVLASLMTICTLILISYFINFIYLLQSTKKALVTLAVVSFVSLILICSGMFFPYSSNIDSPKPKRVFLQHVTRTFHGLTGEVEKRDSGIWINGFDYTGLSHVTPHIPELNETVRAPCDNAPFCGFPWYFPVHHLIRKNWYLPAPPAPVTEATDFKLVSREETPGGSTRLHFKVKGPSHMTIYIQTHPESELSSWSLGDGIPVTSGENNYFIFYSHGLHAPAWQFWIEIKNSSEERHGVVTVAVGSHFFFGDSRLSSPLYALESRFPAWSFPSSWVCTYDLYVY